MVVCGVCKQTKEPKNKWIIKEHAVDNSILRDFKVCDECAVDVIRRIVKDMDPAQDVSSLVLTRMGLIDSIVLNSDNSLEITLLMDLAKARKIILGEVEKKPEQKPPEQKT